MEDINCCICLEVRLIIDGFPLNAVREHNYEAARLQEEARVEAIAVAHAQMLAADAARQERLAANRLARRQLEAARHAAPEMVAIIPNEDGAIVLRTAGDYAALDQRFNARHPAGTRAQVLLGAGMEIGHLPFNARPMLACVGCNKKTRRVCGECNDAHCCAACNNCADGCGFHHPANYQRV